MTQVRVMHRVGMGRQAVDVLILGAGAAGLAAARETSRAGFRSTILEARPRVGGRILSLRDPLSPLSLELGAEFVHGETPDTFDLLRAARLAVDELPDRHAQLKHGASASMDGLWDEVEAMRKGIHRTLRRGRDRSVADYLEAADVAPAVRERLRHFVEGFHAARTDRISAASLDGPGDTNGKQFRLAAGYGALVEWMQASLDPDRTDVRLSTAATSVRWAKGAVEVHAESATGAPLEPFRARAAVVALPLALLKAKALRFEPALPDRERALERLEVGQVFKIVLRFREPFWDEAELNFAHLEDVAVPVWWTSQPSRLPRLTGWAGGPKAERLLRLPERARVDAALESLAAGFGVPPGRLDDLLDGWAAHDWAADPYSRGAYAYVGVGGVPAQARLAKPVEGTLFFAGEALDPEAIGTVGAALTTGRKAGRAVVTALRASRA